MATIILFIFFYKKFVSLVNLTDLHTVVYEPVVYTIFTVILCVLMLLSIILLFVKYLKSDKVFKKSILLVLIAVVLGVIAGSVFNLYAMYFDEFRFYYLGPLFTLAINFVAFYLIISAREKKLEY